MWPNTRSSRSPTLGGLQQFLLLGDLQVEVRGDGIGELARVLDLVERDQHLGRDLLVELDVLLELRRPRCGPAPPAPWRRRRSSGSGSTNASKIAVGLLEAGDLRARWPPSTSTFTVPSGSFSSCRIVRDRADAIDVVGRRDRPARRSSARPAGSACRPSSPLPARAPISRGRRTAARSCAGTRRYRAAAARAADRRARLAWRLSPGVPAFRRRPIGFRHG